VLFSHGSDAIHRVFKGGKSNHVPLPTNPRKRRNHMFVRARWRIKRLIDIKQTLREMEVPSTRNADLLGISGPDFSKMTRGLFDR
jgi:hypothetical protein